MLPKTMLALVLAAVAVTTFAIPAYSAETRSCRHARDAP